MQRKQPQVIDGKAYWTCPKCSELLPEEAFYKSKKTWNGITSQCRKCHTEGNIRTRNKELHRQARRESMRNAREREPEKYRSRDCEASRAREKNERTAARVLLNAAVSKGLVVKPSLCSSCNRAAKLTAHHHDYTKPLDVVWLCYECHGIQHRKD